MVEPTKIYLFLIEARDQLGSEDFNLYGNLFVENSIIPDDCNTMLIFPYLLFLCSYCDI